MLGTEFSTAPHPPPETQFLYMTLEPTEIPRLSSRVLGLKAGATLIAQPLNLSSPSAHGFELIEF